ncbi:MAG: amidohydrolase family protein [Flavobacteriales bacterium]|nr:amidohydrolase family protein [Flavobacteriales bacterium]
MLLAGILLCAGWVRAQETFPYNGIPDHDHRYYAFTHARLVTDPSNIIEDGTLLIRNGKVEKTGKDVSIPAGSVVYDLKGKSIYPSFIDAYSTYGMPEVSRDRSGRGTQYESNKTGPFAWNQALQPETDASALFTPDEKEAGKLRAQGFGALNIYNPDGISRGNSSLVSLADKNDNELVLSGKVAAMLSFNRGSSRQSYPTSLMGCIALIRQTYMDATWYKQNPTEYNLSLEAWNNLQKLPQIFEAANKLNALRADRLGDEFGQQYIIKGNGDEYQRIDEIKKTGATFIIPVKFPEAYDVSDPYDAMMVDLEELEHWEKAPTNAARLAKAGVPFALTASDLKDPKDFLPNLRKAMMFGLTEQQALSALTTTPAKILRADQLVGSLTPGKLANFIITSGPVFDEETTLYENWTLGQRHVIEDMNRPDIRGTYELSFGDRKNELKISGQPAKPEGKLMVSDSASTKAAVKFDGTRITISFQADTSSKDQVRLSGVIGDSVVFKGRGQTENGMWVSWQAIRTKPYENKDHKHHDDEPDEAALAPYVVAFGRTAMPTQETVLIRHATIWTNTDKGMLLNADILIQNGKVVKVGILGDMPGIHTIDGSGMHITPGIIDEHSHIAGNGGINEAGQAISAEVRVGDILNPEDINIYRQLAGGVTAVQVLHGSANPIGGQSALIKLRWGASAEDMKIKGSDGFIKFALGENVKWSNRSPDYNDRYPQTRMGVEQIYYKAFTEAREYDNAWKKYQAAKKGPAPRRDLELETLAEILNKKRFITCHSYVQSEINMLMHVADSMGFRVNTFTHILEGYKVADKMKAHGVGGSTFSDWWAYKMEVRDAIPYNGPLMHNEGVTVAYNSDDAEMARRLNQEAAKAVMYGGLSEVEALKFVTLNPAKLLHLDKRMGSLQPGMDADVVLWTGHPLSIYSKVEKTFVDGRCLFDRKEDAQMQEMIAKERERLIQKMMAEGGKGGHKPAMKGKRLYHCDTLEDEPYWMD